MIAGSHLDQPLILEDHWPLYWLIHFPRSTCPVTQVCCKTCSRLFSAFGHKEKKLMAPTCLFWPRHFCMHQAKDGKSGVGLTLDNVSQLSLLHEQQQHWAHHRVLETVCSSGPSARDSRLSFNFPAALGCKQHYYWKQNDTEDLFFMLTNKILKQCDVG